MTFKTAISYASQGISIFREGNEDTLTTKDGSIVLSNDMNTLYVPSVEDILSDEWELKDVQ